MADKRDYYEVLGVQKGEGAIAMVDGKARRSGSRQVRSGCFQ